MVPGDRQASHPDQGKEVTEDLSLSVYIHTHTSYLICQIEILCRQYSEIIEVYLLMQNTKKCTVFRRDYVDQSSLLCPVINQVLLHAKYNTNNNAIIIMYQSV